MKIAVRGLRGYGLGTRNDLDALLADWQAMFPDKEFGGLFLSSKDDLSLATHVLMINYTDLPPELDHIPLSRVVHMSMEPVAFLPLSRYRQQVLQTRARLSIGGVSHPQLHGMSRPGFVLVPSPHIQQIPRQLLRWTSRATMSIVFSNANTAPGHKYRHELAQAIWKANLPVDFWGHGAHSLCSPPSGESISIGDQRIKGSFQHVEPYENYKFTIAIENHQQGFYFTEKVTLPIYCGCMPLYLGSPHIQQFFPDATRSLTGDVQTDLRIIVEMLDMHNDKTWEENVSRGRIFFQQHWHWSDYVRQLFRQK